METTATYFSRFERTFVSPAGVTVYEYYDAESHTWVAKVIARPDRRLVSTLNEWLRRWVDEQEVSR